MENINFNEFEVLMLNHRNKNGFYENVIITLKENNKLLKKEAIQILNKNYEYKYITLQEKGKLNYSIYESNELFKKPYFINKNIYISKKEHLELAENAVKEILLKVLEPNKSKIKNKMK